MTSLIGSPLPAVDLFTHITIDPRLSALEYGIVPAGAFTPPTETGIVPAPPVPFIPLQTITVDPRTEFLTFDTPMTAPAIAATPSPAPFSVAVVQIIHSDPRLHAASYAPGSPWAALAAAYR